MLVELRPNRGLQEGNALRIGSVLGSILDAVDGDTLEASQLRVVFDWIQYKRNFRDAVDVRPITGRCGRRSVEIAVDLRRGLAEGADFDVTLARALECEHDAGRSYLEAWQPMRKSLIWDFNSLYWKHLSVWESVSGRGYEQSLPGGESDARNVAAARETILELFRIWDALAVRKALPDQLSVVELGVGNGNQARVWLDEFVRLDRERERDYYRRLHYLMGDYSRHLLDVARRTVWEHADHVSGLVLDATRPADALGFLKGKAFLIYISNVYDNLPTDEIARIGSRDYIVRCRAFIDKDRVASISASIGIEPDQLPAVIMKLLKLGPELMVDTYGEHFADERAVARFWQDLWESLRLAEQYTLLQPLDQYEIAEGVKGDFLRSILESHGDIRMHVSNGAVGSFVDTLPLLHPHGFLQCHDLFVTETEQYATGFRGPGKYEGSVVNWCNGALLTAVARRRGYDVSFAKFGHRTGSNVTTLTARIRE